MLCQFSVTARHGPCIDGLFRFLIGIREFWALKIAVADLVSSI
jgi:hypothetical protein